MTTFLLFQMAEEMSHSQLLPLRYVKVRGLEALHMCDNMIKKLTTAGLPISETHTKNQFADKPEGLRQFRDHRWKALDEENSDLPGIFFCDHLLNS